MGHQYSIFNSHRWIELCEGQTQRSYHGRLTLCDLLNGDAATGDGMDVGKRLRYWLIDCEFVLLWVLPLVGVLLVAWGWRVAPALSSPGSEKGRQTQARSSRPHMPKNFHVPHSSPFFLPSFSFFLGIAIHTRHDIG